MFAKISFSGPAGCGKNYIADHLHREFGILPLSFATPMKKVVADITGLSLQEVELVKEGKLLPEKQVAMRRVLQMLGTEVFRDTWDENVWVDNLLRRARKAEAEAYEANARGMEFGGPALNGVAVTDCRFRNEFDALRNDGFLMVYVTCPPEYRRLRGSPAALHPSETDLLDYYHAGKFHLVLRNDRVQPVDDLARNIMRLALARKASP